VRIPLASRWSKSTPLVADQSFDPGGVTAISRGLSEATPPEKAFNLISTPEGSHHGSRRDLLTTLIVPLKY
jgi:hypothetical protein